MLHITMFHVKPPLKGTIMATKVELPKAIVAHALQQAISLRVRNKNSALNETIRKALEEELVQLQHAINTLSETK